MGFVTLMQFATSDTGMSFVCCTQPSNASDRSSNRRIKREIEGIASSESDESGFTYRTTRGNQPRHRHLSVVSPLAHNPNFTDANLPKATERSRTRPLRSIYIVYTSASWIPDSVGGSIVAGALAIAQRGRRVQLDETYTGDGLDRHCECVVWG